MTELFTCPGCHDGDFADFDHYCDVLDITEAETPMAFGAWLANTIGWDGKMGRVICDIPEGSN